MTVEQDTALCMPFGSLVLQLSGRFLAPNLRGLKKRLKIHVSVRTSVRPYVRTSVDSDFSEVYGSNSLKLYAKIRYGLRIMHGK